MAFTHDLPAAARRTVQAADTLVGTHRRDVAGYLYGIAAECAVKALMEEIPGLRQDDLFHEHFPKLRTLLLEALTGRRGKILFQLIQHDSFMSNWSIKMRYADAKQIKDEWVNVWSDQAHRAVNTIGTIG